jgi:hypothetical protein
VHEAVFVLRISLQVREARALREWQERPFSALQLPTILQLFCSPSAQPTSLHGKPEQPFFRG